jgi:hypothetical protein
MRGAVGAFGARDETATIIELINVRDLQRLAVRCRAAFRDSFGISRNPFTAP